jgi:hypothetical protein
LAIVLILATATPARANHAYGLGGGVLIGLSGGDAGGLVIGGDVRIALVIAALGSSRTLDPFNWLWAGVYADGVRDFGANTNRFSGGLQLGAAMIGLDAGGLVDTTSHRTGISLRPHIPALEIFSFYFRWDRYIDDLPRNTVVEAGVTVHLIVFDLL